MATASRSGSFSHRRVHRYGGTLAALSAADGKVLWKTAYTPGLASCEDSPTRKLHARQVKRTFPEVALQRHGDAAVAVKVAEPFAELRVGKMPVGPIVDLAVHLLVFRVAGQLMGQQRGDDRFVVRPSAGSKPKRSRNSMPCRQSSSHCPRRPSPAKPRASPLL